MYRSTQDFWDVMSFIGMIAFCHRISESEADALRERAHADLEAFHIAHPSYNPYPPKRSIRDSRRADQNAAWDDAYREEKERERSRLVCYTPAGPYYLPGHPNHWRGLIGSDGKIGYRSWRCQVSEESIWNGKAPSKIPSHVRLDGANPRIVRMLCEISSARRNATSASEEEPVHSCHHARPSEDGSGRDSRLEIQMTLCLKGA